MRRTTLLLALAAAVVAVDLLPLVLIVKQAVTPESESFAWPPTWWPRRPTLENFGMVRATIELGRGLWMSALVAVLTVGSTLALALPAAWLAARRPAQADRPLDAVMIVTRLFPSIALAVPLAALFVHVGLYNHPAALGLWLAHTLLGLPFAFLVLRTGFRAVPVELEEAARLDGATGIGSFVRVTLPLMRPALAVAALLVFLISWDEFAYALLLQVTNRPLPPLLYYLAAFGHPGLASAVATIMLGPALLIVLVLEPALRSGALTGSGR
ncbi:MAG: carbohydrate ABC transporter permease [Deltaproteobacteria bacterium]|nr:carbohydrate ABC transporter permease [Deltaproteobacteria bacterium]